MPTTTSLGLNGGIGLLGSPTDSLKLAMPTVGGDNNVWGDATANFNPDTDTAIGHNHNMQILDVAVLDKRVGGTIEAGGLTVARSSYPVLTLRRTGSLTAQGGGYISFNNDVERAGFMGFGGIGVNLSIANELPGGDVRLDTTAFDLADLEANSLLNKNRADSLYLTEGTANGLYISNQNDDTVTANTQWQDNNEVRLGNSADGRLYHNGASTIFDNYTGGTYLRNYSDTADFIVQSHDGTALQTRIYINGDGNTYLRDNNGTTRVDLYTTGGTLAGNWTTSGTHIVNEINADDGTAGDPSYTFSSNTDTGMYLSGSRIMFTTNNDFCAAIDDDGPDIVDSHTVITAEKGDTRYLAIGAKAADSDKLDGINSSSFLRSDANDSTSHTLTIAGKLTVNNEADINSIEVDNGSDGAPSYSFKGNTDTGMYLSGSRICFSYNNDFAAAIDDDGTATVDGNTIMTREKADARLKYGADAGIKGAVNLDDGVVDRMVGVVTGVSNPSTGRYIINFSNIGGNAIVVAMAWQNGAARVCTQHDLDTTWVEIRTYTTTGTGDSGSLTNVTELNVIIV